MPGTNTIYSRNGLSRIDDMPETINELFHLAIELNQQITDGLLRILPALPDYIQKTAKNLLFYQNVEKTNFIELLHNELNNSYRAFYHQNKDFINVYMRKEKLGEGSKWIKKSLEALQEKINNLEYISQKNKALSEVDFLILHLGLRDYCSNMFQQMSANYRVERLSSCCQQLVALLDQVSDEIGEAYTAQK